MSATLFAARFVAGGAVIALLPLLSQRFSPAVAGVAMLIPAVSVVGLAALGHSQGSLAVGAAALAGVYGLLAVAVFLLLVGVAATYGASTVLSLAIGMVGWLVVAAGILAVRSAT